MILVGVYNLQKNGGGIIMKRLIAITLFICLLLCGCQAANPTPTESAAESDLVTSKAPAVESTEVTTEDITESTSVQPKKVTVYLLEKAVFFVLTIQWKRRFYMSNIEFLDFKLYLDINYLNTIFETTFELNFLHLHC